MATGELLWNLENSFKLKSARKRTAKIDGRTLKGKRRYYPEVVKRYSRLVKNQKLSKNFKAIDTPRYK